jgi:hypothetical protein
MKTLKISIHSVIDLITNSSTEIFTDYSNSVEPLKEFLNEILKACGVNKSCDEVFEIELDDIDDEYIPATLNIHAKDEKFENVVKLLEKFLDSPEEKEFYS